MCPNSLRWLSSPTLWEEHKPGAKHTKNQKRQRLKRLAAKGMTFQGMTLSLSIEEAEDDRMAGRM